MFICDTWWRDLLFFFFNRLEMCLQSSVITNDIVTFRFLSLGDDWLSCQARRSRKYTPLYGWLTVGVPCRTTMRFFFLQYIYVTLSPSFLESRSIYWDKILRLAKLNNFFFKFSPLLKKETESLCTDVSETASNFALHVLSTVVKNLPERNVCVFRDHLPCASLHPEEGMTCYCHLCC